MVADRPVNRIALFIDGLNLYATSRALGFDIDHRLLLKQFESQGTLLRAFYYTRTSEDLEVSSVRPFIDWLDYNGFTVITKPTRACIDTSGQRVVKCSMDIDLAVDVLELAGHVDRIVLFSGDGNFRRLVMAVQRRGVHVTVVSTGATQPAMVAHGLRRQADAFIDLLELKPKIGRIVTGRPRAALGTDQSTSLRGRGAEPMI